MPKKTKILFGILIVGIILISWLWILAGKQPVLQTHPVPFTSELTEDEGEREAPLLSIPPSSTETVVKSTVEKDKTIVTTEDYKITKLLVSEEFNFDDIISKKITIEILNYSISEDGLILIKGVDQNISDGEPILPYFILDTQAASDNVRMEVNFNENSSSYVVIKHKIPLGDVGWGDSAEIIDSEKFSHNGFYPTSSYWTNSVFGLGGNYKNYFLGATLIQYNPKTKETKIWEKIVFDVQYHLPSTDFTKVILSTDKQEYNSDEKIGLTVSLKNKKHTRAVNLSLLLKDFVTGEEIITLEKIGSMGVSGMENEISTGTYAIDLQKIRKRLIENKVIQAELIVCNPINGEALTSGVVFFKIIE